MSDQPADPKPIAPIASTDQAAPADELDRLRELAYRWTWGFERSAVGQGVTTLDGRFLMANDRLCEITGYTREALMTRTFRDITHPDDLDAAARLTDDMMSGRRHSGRYEKRYVRPDGGVVWAGVTVTLVRDARGQPLYMMSSVDDIDERKRIEGLLQEREALLQNLTRHTPGMLFKCLAHPDGSWRVSYVSEGVRDLYEREPEEVQADIEALLSRVHPDDRAATQAYMQEAVRSLGAPPFELRVLLPRRGLRWLETKSTALRQPDGTVVFYGHTADITHNKLYAEAQLAAEVAQHASQAKSEFLSRMSHELRTPLNAVIGFAQLLRVAAKPPLLADQVAKVELIERAGAHLLAVISDVLDLSRIEAGNLPLSIETLDARSTLDDALSLVQVSARQSNVALRVPRQTGDGHLRADRVRLRQVLVNLLSNAVKYNRAGGEVRCSISQVGDQVRIDIADTGAGMTAAQLEHLFEPFNRLGAERAGIEGTGIGLVIVRRLTELMGGRLDIDSELGRGTRVAVSLPTAVQPKLVGQSAVAVDSTHGGTQNDSDHQPQTAGHVLYAEDNEINVMLVQQVMALRPACRLTIAKTGADAIEAARQLRPDLLLLDMHLGDMTGFEVAAELDRDPTTAVITKVALSADAMPDQIHRAKASGFASYLTKPLDVVALLSCLDEHLQLLSQASS